MRRGLAGRPGSRHRGPADSTGLPAWLVRPAVFARLLGLSARSLLLARHAKALLRFFQRRFGGGNLIVHVVGIAHGKTFRPASSNS